MLDVLLVSDDPRTSWFLQLSYGRPDIGEEG
jgi:hypothetical protein